MNTNKTITQVGIILVLVIMPLAIGIPLFLANRDRPEFLEIPLAIFGVFELLVLTVRIQVRDNKKRKAGNLKEDKDSEEYQSHVNFRKIILISAFINLALSLVAFWIFGRGV